MWSGVKVLQQADPSLANWRWEQIPISRLRMHLKARLLVWRSGKTYPLVRISRHKNSQEWFLFWVSSYVIVWSLAFSVSFIYSVIVTIVHTWVICIFYRCVFYRCLYKDQCKIFLKTCSNDSCSFSFCRGTPVFQKLVFNLKLQCSALSSRYRYSYVSFGCYHKCWWREIIRVWFIKINETTLPSS